MWAMIEKLRIRLVSVMGAVLSIAGAPIKQGNVYVAANSGLLP